MNKTSKMWTLYYICSCLGRDGCKAKLHVTHTAEGESFKVVGEHDCRQRVAPVVYRDGVIDVKEEMREKVENRCLIDISKSAKDIAMEVMRCTQEKYVGEGLKLLIIYILSFLFYLFYIQLLSDKAFLYLDVQFMQALVYRIRHREHGDVDAVIKGHPLAFCIKDARYFLQFDATVVVDGELQRLIGWGHPRLIGLLKCGPTHLFIDGTFRIVPCGWYHEQYSTADWETADDGDQVMMTMEGDEEDVTCQART